MGRADRPAGKRPLSPRKADLSPRKRLLQNVDRIREIAQESAHLQSRIAVDYIEAVALAASVAASTASASPGAAVEVQKPSRTLFDFDFSKSTVIATANGTSKVITVTSTAAAEGTTLTTLGARASLKPGMKPCRYADKGCKKVLGNVGAEVQHALFCPLRLVRQMSIRTSSEYMSAAMIPQIIITDTEKKRVDAQAAAEKIAALPEAKRAMLKVRKDGRVDLRGLCKGGLSKRQRYSCLFKARVVRALIADTPMEEVIDRFSPDLFHRLQETMLFKYESVVRCRLCSSPTDC
jgi:hypothetical protein